MVFFGDYFIWYYQRNFWWVWKDYIGVNMIYYFVEVNFFGYIVQFFLECSIWSYYYCWQYFKCVIYQIWQIVVNNQFVDILSQFLNMYVFIEFRIFMIQRWQYVFYMQVQVECMFKVSQSMQQVQCFGFIDIDVEQEQQVIWIGFFNNDVMFVEVFCYDVGWNIKVVYGVVFFYFWSQQGDFDWVKIYVFVIDVFEVVSGVVRMQWLVFSCIDMIWLLYIKELVIRFCFQMFDFFMEFDCMFNRIVDQMFICIVFYYCCSGFSGCYDIVVWRSGGVYYVGFVKGFFVYVIFNVDYGSLRECCQQFVSGLGFVNYFFFYMVIVYIVFTFVNW